MHRFILAYKPASDAALRAAQTAARTLTTHNATTFLAAHNAPLADFPNLQALPLAECQGVADAVICLGGDGTLLRALQAMAPTPIPILGINLGRLGFMVDITAAQLEEALSALMAGDYAMDTRLMLKAQAEHATMYTAAHDEARSTAPQYALNEVVFHKSDPARMVELAICVDGDDLGTFRADGLIIHTPTGSTAYSLSAGGAIVHPSVAAIGITTICPHTWSHRPLLVPMDATIDVHAAQDAKVSFDGQAAQQFAGRMRIQKATKPLPLLHLAGHRYYRTLRTKLKWGDGFISAP